MRMDVRSSTSVTLAVLCLGIVPSALLCSGCGAKAGPVYDLGRKSFNWGNVLPGSEVSTRFTVRNIGGEALSLGEPKTSCGCTRPELPAGPIPPGGRAEIRVQFRVPMNLGTVRHTVAIPTNSKTLPPIELTLFATAWTGVQTSPQAVDVGHVRPGETVERDLQVFSPDSRPFRIGHIEVEPPEASAQFEHKGLALPLHRVRVRFRAANRLGQLKGLVRIMTDREDAHPVLDVPLVGRIVGDITVSPSSLEIRSDQIGSVVRRMLVMTTSKKDETVGISDVTASLPWRVVDSFVRPLATRGATIDLGLRLPSEEPVVAGELKITISSPTNTSVIVPLTIQGWTPPVPEGSPRAKASE